MEKTFIVNIVTQGSQAITAQIQSLHTKSEGGEVEFRAGYTPIIISTVPAVTKVIKADGSNEIYFTASGIIVIENNLMKFCCDSADRIEDIDLSRAIKSKERAEARLNEKKKDDIDEVRAKLALARASARISAINIYRN
ncbi:MAG: ATP synthase delta/epsilon chain alpha-helix domain-containing protein [Clostridium sp.]